MKDSPYFQKLGSEIWESIRGLTIMSPIEKNLDSAIILASTVAHLHCHVLFYSILSVKLVQTVTHNSQYTRTKHVSPDSITCYKIASYLLFTQHSERCTWFGSAGVSAYGLSIWLDRHDNYVSNMHSIAMSDTKGILCLIIYNLHFIPTRISVFVTMGW